MSAALEPDILIHTPFLALSKAQVSGGQGGKRGRERGKEGGRLREKKEGGGGGRAWCAVGRGSICVTFALVLVQG